MASKNPIISSKKKNAILKHKEFLYNLKDQLELKCMEDWYNVSKKTVYKYRGKATIKYFGSLPQALKVAYSDHHWLPWKFFGQVPKNYWQQESNRRAFFDWLFVQLGYKTMEDWYSITQKDIYQHGGVSIIDSYYNNSPSKALKSLYPEHQWLMWKFLFTPKHYKSQLMMDDSEMEKFVNWLSKELSIDQLEDWYRVSVQQIQKYLDIQSSKSLIQILKTVYKQHNWNVNKFTRLGRSVKSTQREVAIAVRKLFPKHGIPELGFYY